MLILLKIYTFIMKTAEEFLKNSKNVNYTSLKDEVKLYFIEQDLIEFAKMHVQEALKQASENASYTIDGQEYITDIWIDKESILNAYPLENIK